MRSFAARIAAGYWAAIEKKLPQTRLLLNPLTFYSSFLSFTTSVDGICLQMERNETEQSSKRCKNCIEMENNAPQLVIHRPLSSEGPQIFLLECNQSSVISVSRLILISSIRLPLFAVLVFFSDNHRHAAAHWKMCWRMFGHQRPDLERLHSITISASNVPVSISFCEPLQSVQKCVSTK